MTTDVKIKAPKKRRNASLDKRKARGGWLFVLPFVLGFVSTFPLLSTRFDTAFLWLLTQT